MRTPDAPRPQPPPFHRAAPPCPKQLGRYSVLNLRSPPSSPPGCAPPLSSPPLLPPHIPFLSSPVPLPPLPTDSSHSRL